MKILFTYGTRPEYLKVQPVIDEFIKQKIPHKTLFTGQHPDLVPQTADFNLQMRNDCDNRLNSVISSSVGIPEECFEGITHVLVQGDTSSVLGLALNAFHRKLKVIHLEAGLRTYDPNNPWPEETNRRIVSQIADIHLCPTVQSYDNLTQEKVLGAMYVVGNTVLDNLVHLKNECEYTDTVLVTLHRRENHESMGEWFHSINSIAKQWSQLEFIFPMHPNPNVQKHGNILSSPNIKIVEPLPHDELMKTLVKVKFVITDSGGLQEESSFFNKICLTCRKATERPEALGQSTVLVKSPSDLDYWFDWALIGHDINYDCPFGDGTSSQQIAEIFKI